MPSDEIRPDRARLLAWLPPVAWMGLILVLSTDAGSAERTGGLLIPLLRWALPWLSPQQVEAVHLLIRKAAHFTEYAVLAALWFRALARSRAPGTTAWLALAIGVAWAVLDEVHQLFVVSRGASVADIALDTAGAATAVGVARWGWRAVDAATTGLLWVAVGGGALALALDLHAGVPSGVLWVSVPAAGVMLVLRRRWGRARRPDRRPATP
jgi:VanZ family protein